MTEQEKIHVADILNYCTDEEFAEIFVLFWKIYNGNMDYITEDDVINFDAKEFCDWLEVTLDEIIKLDDSCWWKRNDIILEEE